MNYLNADRENNFEANYQQLILQHQDKTNNKFTFNNKNIKNSSTVISQTKIPKQTNPYFPGQQEDKRSSIPYISYALAENLYSNNLLNKLDNFNTNNNNKNNRLSDDDSTFNIPEITINLDSNNTNNNQNQETNITDKTLEDIRYEQLLKKYLENRNPEELIQISTFFDRVDGQSYEGKWQANSPRQSLQALFGAEALEGSMDLTFQKYTEFSRFITQSTTYRLRLLKGSYIDSWLQMQGFALTFTNITLKDNVLTAGYSSFLEFGELFERKGDLGYCDGVFTLMWDNESKNDDSNNGEGQNKDSTDSEKQNSEKIKEGADNYLKSFGNYDKENNGFRIKRLNGSFKSNCKVDVSFELSLADEKVVNDKIVNYSIVYSIFCLLQLFNTMYLSKKIDESNSFSNGVTSLIFFIVNI